MELKNKDKNGCFPAFGNNFLTLFGLMVLDDEDRKRRKSAKSDDIMVEGKSEYEVDNDTDDQE